MLLFLCLLVVVIDFDVLIFTGTNHQGLLLQLVPLPVSLLKYSWFCGDNRCFLVQCLLLTLLSTIITRAIFRCPLWHIFDTFYNRHLAQLMKCTYVVMSIRFPFYEWLTYAMTSKYFFRTFSTLPFPLVSQETSCKNEWQSAWPLLLVAACQFMNL